MTALRPLAPTTAFVFATACADTSSPQSATEGDSSSSGDEASSQTKGDDSPSTTAQPSTTTDVTTDGPADSSGSSDPTVDPSTSDSGEDSGGPMPLGPSPGCGSQPGSILSGSINAAGIDREYIIQLPDDYDPDYAYPLIFGFHGLGENMDGARWRFHLRPGVHFHDGSTFDAGDVVWTFNTLLDGSVASSKSGAFPFLERVVEIDPATVDFELKTPFGALLPNLTSYLGIVPAGTTPEQMNRTPVGTGPFRFVARTADTVELRAFDDYYLGRPHLDRVVLREIPEATVRVLELRKGSVQLVVNALPPDVVPLFRADPNFQVPTATGSNYVYLGLNLTDPRLADRRVREGLALALDRELLVRTLWRGLGVVTETLLPPGHWARNEELPPTPYDPRAAAARFDEAGLTDPDGPGPLPRLRLTYKTSTDETALLQAQILQAMWREVGVEVEIRSYEFATFYDDIKRGNFQLFSLTWTGDRRPRHLHAHPAFEACAPRGLKSRSLRESAFRRADRARRESRRPRCSPPLLFGSASDPG